MPVKSRLMDSRQRTDLFRQRLGYDLRLFGGECQFLPERLADVAAFLCKLAKLSNSGALMQHRKSSSPCLVAGDVVPVGRCDGSQRPVVIGEQRSQFGLYQFRDCRHDLAVPAGTGPQCGEGNAGEDGRSLVGKTKQNRRGIPGVNNYGWSEIQTRFT